MFETTRTYNKLKIFKSCIICIEGNIGIGKTTLGKNLEELFTHNNIKAKFFPEKVQSIFLNMYLGNIDKYSFTFQLIMLLNCISVYEKAMKFIKKGGVAIIDRSIIGNYIFCKYHFEKKLITAEEFNIYMKYYSDNGFFVPDIILHLDGDVDIIMDRIKTRGTFMEVSTYENKYIEDINQEHKITLKDQKNVLTVDWNKNIKVLTEDYIMEKIINPSINILFKNSTS